MHDLETALAALVKDTDQIDGGIGTFQRGGDVVGPRRVTADGDDLADVALGLQIIGAVGAAHGHSHPPATTGQRTDHLTADEAGAAEDGDQAGGDFVHGELLRGRRETGRTYLAEPLLRRGLDDAPAARNAIG